MLCPEVSNFKAPESNFQFEKGQLHKTFNPNKINSFYNHLVSVTLPDTLQVPEELTGLLSNNKYFKITNLNLIELVNNNFINNFVKKGGLSVLTINRRIDCDDCICLTPDGSLILSLTKETFQSLGIEGKASQFGHRTKNRFVVRVNLLLDQFKPGKKNYEKIKINLAKLEPFTVIIACDPADALFEYFDNLKYEIKSCTPSFKTRIDYSLQVPLIDFDHIDLEEGYDISEWLGVYALNCSSGTCEDYLNTYEPPQPAIKLGQVRYLEWRGFFTGATIVKFLHKLSDHIKGEDKIWAALYVQGFSDSPVNWGSQEHHYYTNGDNSFVIFLEPSGKYVLCKQTCSLKRYK